jgi:hypothetical protein
MRIENFEIVLGPGGTSVGGWTIHRRGQAGSLSPREISALAESFEIDYRRHGAFMGQGTLNPRDRWWHTMDTELVYYSGELLPLNVARIRGMHDPVQIFFDWMPLPEQKTLFHTLIVRHGCRSHTYFQLTRKALTKWENDWLDDFLAREHQHQINLIRMTKAITSLLDVSLWQRGVADKAERDKKVRDLMLYGSKPSAPFEPIPLTRKGFGVSPSLIFISRRIRNRLWRLHRIDVDELERESERLFHDVEHFWEVIPPEAIPLPGRYFSYAAKKFDELTIVHHEKVRQLGGLLGGKLGKVLMIQAELSIKELTAQLAQNAPNPDP